MSTSDQMSLVRLDVRTPDAATEIFIIDGRFRLIDRGLGYLRTELEPGLYKVKIRAGFMTHEECVILPVGSREIVKEFPGIKFSSAAPLTNTAKADVIHMIAAEKESRRIHVESGQGSWIFIFVREWNIHRQSTISKQGYLDPARGLTLKDMQGNVVVDLAKQSHHEFAETFWAACNVQVDPGSYRLSLDTPFGTLEQTIIAAVGWQTQVFLLLRLDDNKPDNRLADLSSASVFLSQPGGFNASDSDLRLVELMRLGIINERQLLPEEIRKMLGEKFKNPMLGIYAAHHLLLNEVPDFQLLKNIVSNLRDLLGIHPDVEALALLIEENDSAYAFTTPPMLRRSWSIIINATIKKPELVPVNSSAAIAAYRLWGSEPWLAWRIFSQKDISHSAEWIPSIEEIFDTEVAFEAGVFLHFLRELLLSNNQPGGVSHQHSQMSLIKPISRLKTSLDNDTLERLVQVLGIPRGNIDALLEIIAAQQTQSVGIEVQESKPVSATLGWTSLSPYNEKAFRNEIDEILEQCDSYIRKVALHEVASKAVSPYFLNMEADDLAQKCRIKLWQRTRARGVSDLRESWQRTLEHRTPNLHTQIQRIVRNEGIDVLRRSRSPLSLSLSFEETNEQYEGLMPISASSEWAQDPQEEIERRESFAELLTATTNAVATLPTRQRIAMICHLKDIFDETLLKAAFEKQVIDIDTIHWPEEKVEARLLKASLSAARKNLRFLIKT